MAQESSASAIDLSSTAGVPLITCPECHKRIVVRRKSKQPWSEGEVFYYCPAHKRNGQGCPFFRWEEEYIAYVHDLEKKRGKQIEDGFDQEQVRQSKMDVASGCEKDEGKGSDDVVVKGSRSLKRTIDELVSWMKIMCVLCLCNLAVLLLILFAMVIKI